MRRRWLCRLCSTTDDGYAGCAEGIEPSDAMTTMTCLFVLACFCLPLSVKPFLCPPVCSSCFAHLLLRASDVPAPQMSKMRRCLSVLSLLFYDLPWCVQHIIICGRTAAKFHSRQWLRTRKVCQSSTPTPPARGGRSRRPTTLR